VHKIKKKNISFFNKKKQYEELLATQQELKKQLTQLTDTTAVKLSVNQQISKLSDRINALADVIFLNSIEKSSEGFATNQEEVCRSKQGFRYIIHHMAENWRATRIPYWKMILELIPGIESACEFACNIGANLKALKYLNTNLKLAGKEINEYAVKLLEKDGVGEIKAGSVITEGFNKEFDLVFSRGVLIHIHPSKIPDVMKNMAKHSRKYVLIYENYSPTLTYPPTYARKVADNKPGEQYQFWQDYPNEFHKLFPDWSIVQSGVYLNIGKKPKQGDLFWTIFKRPGM